MTLTRSVPRFGALVAVLALLIAVWHPNTAEPETPDLVVQGRHALDADKADDAIALLEKAVAANPNDPAALAWLGTAQVRKARTAAPVDAPGWVKKGFNTLDEAVERFPNTFIVYMLRGITAARVPDLFKKAPAAVKDLSAVVAMKEKDTKAVPDAVMPSIYLSLGLAYKKTGQTAEARTAWEKGKTLYPAAPEAQAINKELQNL